MKRVLHNRDHHLALVRRDREAPGDRVLQFRDQTELRVYLGRFLHDPSNREIVRNFLVEQLVDQDEPMDLPDDALCDRLAQMIDAGVVNAMEASAPPPLVFGGGGSGSGAAIEPATTSSGATVRATPPSRPAGTPISAGGAGAAAGLPAGAGGSPALVSGAGLTPTAAVRSGSASAACRLGSLEVMRSQGPSVGPYTAPYVLKLTPGDPRPGTLEVVGGSTRKAARVKCVATMASGPCGPHGERAFDVSSDARLISSGANAVTMDVPAPANQEIATDKWYRAIWPAQVRPRPYTVRARSCDGAASAKILSYPDLHWRLQIPIPIAVARGVKVGVKKSTSKDVSTGSMPGGGYAAVSETSEREVSAGTSQGIVIEVTSDGQTRSLNQDFENYIKRSVAFAQKAVEMTDQAIKGVQKVSGGSLEWTFFWPNLNFTGEWGWKEVEEKPVAGFEAEFGFKALPLIGAEGTYDVLDGLLQLASALPGGIAVVRVIQKARQLAKEGADIVVGEVSAEIAIPLTLSGMINGVVTGTKPAEADRIDVKGEIQGIVKARLEGKVSAELTTHCFFEIKVGAGAKIGGELTLLDATLVAGSDEQGIYLDGSLKGFGGKIYSATWVENKFSLESSSKESTEYLRAHAGPGHAGAAVGSASDETKAGRSVGTKGEKETELAFWESFDLLPKRKPVYLMKKG